MYSLNGHGVMISDRVRMGVYSEALRKVIQPGAVVVDIGTGTGVMAVLASQFGAGRVFAIEPCEIIQVAREIALANQCSDKIEFFEELSTKVSLPVRANVIVSDLRGVLPLFGNHILSIVDARKRFLLPGGSLIGRMDRMWAAVVEAPETFGKVVNAWDRNLMKQDLGPARVRALNDFSRARVNPEQLLTIPKLWATLDYHTIENPDFRGSLQWKTERAGIAHGVLVWFEAELADGVSFSTGPAAPETVWSAAFLPWEQPVPLVAGQAVCFELEAKFLEDDYFWRWDTQIESPNGSGEIALRFAQSQLRGSVFSLSKLTKSASDYVPQLSENGRLQLRALELMKGDASLEQIARRLTEEFPGRFARWQQALTFAGALSQENSK